MNNLFKLKSLALLLGTVTTIASAQSPQGEAHNGKSDSIQRKADLQYILSLLPPDRTSNGRVSYHDEVFTDWLNRTGELPPDWSTLPSIPYLPDPLVLNKNGKTTPVKNLTDWKSKRKDLKQQLEYYITGTYPKQPDNLKATVISSRLEGEVVLQLVELSFGPKRAAKLTVELMIPPGNGPFPVFLTQWNHREWAQTAVKRGYIGCVYAAADSKDDTEDYARIWADQHDFTRLMRRAYGTFVAIDYLHTLPVVDKKKIGITGHSRNGKLSLIAAAFDERITAVVTSSGGSGAEVPWRYAAYPYDVEDIALLTSAQPAWFHPRLRFFTGRENRLPIDQNSFMALVAPRGLMLSTAVSESASNPWGAEQALKSAGKVYNFLNAGDQVMIRYRNGLHGTTAKEIEGYVDFFDFIFKRSPVNPASPLMHPYTFADWKVRSKEQINSLAYPKKEISEISTNSTGSTITANTWPQHKEKIQEQLRWLLGTAPPLVRNYGPRILKNQGAGEEYAGTFLTRPAATKKMAVMKITPYKGFGDGLFGYLYYPAGAVDKAKLPVVIYLHEYDYGKGFSNIGHQHELQSFFGNLVDQGYAVMTYDMIGFGNRIEEGIRFYERYPKWSKMGKMVTDVDAAVLAMQNLEFIDPSKIYTAGYALGATVGLYAAALNPQIAGTISVAGFTPMRTDAAVKGTSGIRFLSHEHGLMPRLGFFLGQEDRIPVDYQDILASIAPRPTLIVAPTKDWNTSPEDIKVAISTAQKIYNLYSAEQQLELVTPNDYNRLSTANRETIFEWLRKR